jgi:hypothetical protein
MDVKDVRFVIADGRVCGHVADTNRERRSLDSRYSFRGNSKVIADTTTTRATLGQVS